MGGWRPHPRHLPMTRLGTSLLALILGAAALRAQATPRLDSEPAPPPALPAPGEPPALSPPTLAEDAPARLPEGLHLEAPVTVELELTIDEAGDVVEARIVGEP